MKTIQDVIEKLEINARVSVQQFSAAECVQMAAIIQSELSPTPLELFAATAGSIAAGFGKAVGEAIDAPCPRCSPVHGAADLGLHPGGDF